MSSHRSNQHTPAPPTAELLLHAYSSGIFPMADPDSGQIDWYSPDPRGILPLDTFHIPRSLRRIVQHLQFEIRTDTVFEEVMHACAQPRESDPDGLTWINDELIHAYCELFRIGHAHSIEAWLDDTLVGGLYGVHIGTAFFGESMFSRPDRGGTNASKVCLVHLVERLRHSAFQLLDTQFWNPHLAQFGCVEIPRKVYLEMLELAILKNAQWADSTNCEESVCEEPNRQNEKPATENQPNKTSGK